MADRRMFSINIVESDAFIEMDAKDQMLYMHLNMYADDDGFIGNAKMIQRQNSVTVNNLIEKKFVIQFPNGICVIKHWRINNQLRKDRYTETKYIELKKLLFIRPNGAYTLNPKDAIPVPMGHFTTSDIDGETGNQTPTERQPRPPRKPKAEGDAPVKNFVKPSLADVTAYCKERSNKINPETFIDHYESNGWKVGGKSPMKDWKASIRTWEKNTYNSAGGSKPANVLPTNPTSDSLAKLQARTIKS